MKTELTGDWMRPKDAAQYMQISTRCLADLMARKIIPHSKLSHKVVLLRRGDLDRAILRRTIKAVA